MIHGGEEELIEMDEVTYRFTIPYVQGLKSIQSTRKDGKEQLQKLY